MDGPVPENQHRSIAMRQKRVRAIFLCAGGVVSCNYRAGGRRLRK